MKSEHIPAPAVQRLSLYLRELEAIRDSGSQTVSSRRLGEFLGLTDAQVRKDLAYFGHFGHPGVGYEVGDLIARIRRILGTDRASNVVLVGAGNLGSALAAYRGFARRGFHLVAVFDNDPAKIGRPLAGLADLVVRPLTDVAAVVREFDVRLAILAVPADAAQQVAESLVAAGVRGLLNFAPVAISVAEDVSVSTVDMAVQLEQLSFRIGAARRASARAI